ncbi:hypothetical protein D3C72_1902210 [compost metagenome]
MFSLPGSFLASANSSARFLAGNSGRTCNTSGVYDTELIGAKSRSHLYASRLKISGENSSGPFAAMNRV